MFNRKKTLHDVLTYMRSDCLHVRFKCRVFSVPVMTIGLSLPIRL